MYWKTPHINKIYEALSAIADHRIVLVSSTEAKVVSSSGNKSYTVTYNPGVQAMMSDDNSAYWTNTISYPMIAFLMVINKVNYDPQYLHHLKNIKWKDINQKLDNDFDKSTNYVLRQLDSQTREGIIKEVNSIYKAVCLLRIKPLGKKRSRLSPIEFIPEKTTLLTHLSSLFKC